MEDLIPRRAGVGPLIPTPLIEEAAPLAPELSLVSDQDKNKSIYTHKTPQEVDHKPRSRLQSNCYTQENNEVYIPNGNECESYNTWGAKHAQALHSITGSLGKMGIVSNHIDNTRNLREYGNDQSSKNYSQDVDSLRGRPIHKNEVPNKMHNSPTQLTRSEKNTLTQKLDSNFQYQNAASINKPSQNRSLKPNENHMRKKPSEYLALNDSNQRYTNSHNQENICSCPSHSNSQTKEHVQNRQIISDNVRDSGKSNTQNICRPLSSHGGGSYNNESNCKCQQQGVILVNGTEGFNCVPTCQNTARIHQLNAVNSKIGSPLDVVQMNNQTVIELLNTIKLHGEQILMLQQQMNQVLQIHLDCDKTSSKQTCKCHSCPCEQKITKENENRSPVLCKNNSPGENILVENKVITSPIVDPDNKTKRSVGIMTSISEENNNPSRDHNSSSKKKGIKINKQHKKQPKLNYSALNHYKQNQERLVQGDRKTQRTSPSGNDSALSSSNEEVCDKTDVEEDSSDRQHGYTFYNRVVGQVNDILKKAPTRSRQKRTQEPKRTPLDHMYSPGGFDTENNWSKRMLKKEEQRMASQVDNSFSLNEAELVIRTNTEHDDESPNTSVQVDLKDYHSSSSLDESDSASSSSNEEYHEKTETEEDSSDPQLGYTFYNRVVGQVNDILKKAPTCSRKKRTQEPKRTPLDHMYSPGGFDTENNWSKRVTFDGPPFVDSGNSNHDVYYNPRAQQSRPNQEFGINGGPDTTMQDLMMYNFANGNKNLSFTTVRYLERYNLLPTPSRHKNPDHMYPASKKSNRQKKKPKKSKNPHMPEMVSKNKRSVPSSKILDITTLKQQPKLF